MTTTESKQVTQTIKEQILAGVDGERWNFFRAVGVSKLLDMNDGRLRLHSARKHINIDITLDEGSDDYTIKAYKLKNRGLDIEVIKDISGIYCDQLTDIVYSILCE